MKVETKRVTKPRNMCARGCGKNTGKLGRRRGLKNRYDAETGKRVLTAYVRLAVVCRPCRRMDRSLRMQAARRNAPIKFHPSRRNPKGHAWRR